MCISPKAAAGPSTAPFAKSANGSAQDDRFIAEIKKGKQHVIKTLTH